MQIDPGNNSQLDAIKASQVNESKKESTVSNGNSPSAVLNLSDSAIKLQDQLKNMDSQEEVRPDAVAEAKAELENWKGLSDDHVDHIMNRMIDEMNI
ncbi:MAG: hypothetical protein NE328_15440 [Lentisphaeraceae bacterium]|nr:hypothetical protein [Lentisphaeraceae bacterium]